MIDITKKGKYLCYSCFKDKGIIVKIPFAEIESHMKEAHGIENVKIIPVGVELKPQSIAG